MISNQHQGYASANGVGFAVLTGLLLGVVLASFTGCKTVINDNGVEVNNPFGEVAYRKVEMELPGGFKIKETEFGHTKGTVVDATAILAGTATALATLYATQNVPASLAAGTAAGAATNVLSKETPAVELPENK